MTRAEVTQSFWARHLDSKVGKDGQVSGFSRWWGDATPFARDRGAVYAEACWIKFERGGRGVEDVIAAGVSAFRGELKMQRHAVTEKDPVYARYRFALLAQVRNDGLRPFEVAALLERDKLEHPAITDEEIDLYVEWDREWGGPIEPGRAVWNPKTRQLEPWPHVEQTELVGTALRAGRDETASGPLLSTEAKGVPAANDDDAPPPPE